MPSLMAHSSGFSLLSCLFDCPSPSSQNGCTEYVGGGSGNSRNHPPRLKSWIVARSHSASPVGAQRVPSLGRISPNEQAGWTHEVSGVKYIAAISTHVRLTGYPSARNDTARETAANVQNMLLCMYLPQPGNSRSNSLPSEGTSCHGIITRSFQLVK
jgi:hypothetical protein